MRSPRTWGWTGHVLGTLCAHAAFPTHVGMDPDIALKLVPVDLAFPTHVGMDRLWLWSWTPPMRVPHARGDGPSYPSDGEELMSVPHARGDGPVAPHRRIRTWVRSPRTWGWTFNMNGDPAAVIAFPTHVGMDREGFQS